jgi:hypothetical protein
MLDKCSSDAGQHAVVALCKRYLQKDSIVCPNQEAFRMSRKALIIRTQRSGFIGGSEDGIPTVWLSESVHRNADETLSLQDVHPCPRFPRFVGFLLGLRVFAMLNDVRLRQAPTVITSLSHSSCGDECYETTTFV